MVHTFAARWVALAALLGLGAAGLVVGATPAVAAECTARFAQDVDGDEGADVVVGVPDWADGTGGVDLRYSKGTSAFVTAATLGLPSASGDRFGSAVAVSDLNEDGCADLVIGAAGRGSVYVAFGSPTGLRASGVAVAEQPQAGAGMGSSVTSYRVWDQQSQRDVTYVAAGAPAHDVGAASDAGAVVVHRLDPGGALTRVAVVTQDTPGVDARAESGDRFGAALDTLHGVALLVGVPQEDVGSAVDAGAVTLVAFDQEHPTRFTGRTTTQDSPGVPGAAEPGDQFGQSLDAGLEVIIGAPGEDVGSVQDAGLVHLFGLFDGGDTLFPGRAFDQGTPGMPGVNEAGDRFGAAVAYPTALLGDQIFTVVVGAPGEDLGSIRDAGAVTIINADQNTERGDRGPMLARGFSQDSGAPGVAEPDDAFGAALWSLSGDSWQDESIQEDLLVGVPGEDVGQVGDAGVVVRVSDVAGGPFSFGWQNLGLSRGRTEDARYGSVPVRR